MNTRMRRRGTRVQVIGSRQTDWLHTPALAAARPLASASAATLASPADAADPEDASPVAEEDAGEVSEVAGETPSSQT